MEVSNIANHHVTGECFKFSVVAVKVYNLWGFGGILISEKGEIRDIFSGLVFKSGWFIAELEAIREALQIFVAADSFGGRALVVESSSRWHNNSTVGYCRWFEGSSWCSVKLARDLQSKVLLSFCKETREFCSFLHYGGKVGV
ncbi:hypothetical protein V6N11_037806 [Hibiscus sabdariffa]|uniref:RNase H type-1 domain-containing protein n=2 Tax=Hibiscus sabdariffa TaxID=183260 RepID=A0ABR2C9F6_9ROSI